MMSRRSIAAFALLALAAALMGAILARLLGTHAVALQSGTWLPSRRAIAEFHLQDLAGEDFDLRRLQGHPTLLFFGFTHCPDVCPTTLQTLAQTQRAAPLPDTQVVFVSVDPERDSAANLTAYLHAFSTDFIGLRGDAAALAPLLHSLGAIAVKQPLPGDTYTMDHSATLYLLDRQARLAAVFSPPFSVAGLADDLHRVAAARAL
jgi:protein SCO1/2